jgi:arylsulfatase A-like enzyme
LSKEGSSGSLGFTEESRKEALSGYFSAMTAMDENVGRLLDWLEENDLRENTLVVFTSDNGMNMGHHGIYGKGNGTFPPNMFDTSVKVPMLVSQPGHVPEGKVISTLHSHYDIMPTLLEYLGAENPEADGLPGRSFVELLNGQDLDGDDHVVVFDEYGPTRMVRTTEWKYVHRYPFGAHELFDLVNDPDEENNLIDGENHHAVREELQAKLDAFFVRYADPERDGSREAVMGRGQLNIVGPAAKGVKRFGDDLLFERDRLKGKKRGE